jgi:cyclopropane fatty-acyl-phospholipid synthase-like methyltransferase
VDKLKVWSQYWQNLDTPLHRSSDDSYYRQYAAELKILFKGKSIDRVLDLGCGNGDLYEFLGFNQASLYKGVDFSIGMLDKFKERYPEVSVECFDASSYREDKKYNLVFSNGVIQYFDYQMLSNHIVNAQAMMEKDSILVLASVPWKLHKFSSMTGESNGIKKNIIKGLVAYGKNTIKDSMGTWYDPDIIIELASANSMRVEFFASMHYMYRFHAVLQML